MRVSYLYPFLRVGDPGGEGTSPFSNSALRSKSGQNFSVKESMLLFICKTSHQLVYFLQELTALNRLNISDIDTYQISFRVDIIRGRGGVPQCWTHPPILDFTSNESQSLHKQRLKWEWSWQLRLSDFLCTWNKKNTTWTFCDILHLVPKRVSSRLKGHILIQSILDLN